MPIITLETKEGLATIECNEGDVLLDAILEAGIEYPHGCRAGSCGACRTLVLAGGELIPGAGTIEKITIEGLIKGTKSVLPKGAQIRLACRVNVTQNIRIKAFY